MLQCQQNRLKEMSTYYPKTLKRWNIQKRSMLDLQEAHPQPNAAISRSFIIHSFERKMDEIMESQPLHKERYKLDQSKPSNMRLSNGFRKSKKLGRSGFSKVVAEDKFVKISNVISEDKEQRWIANNIVRMIAKKNQLKSMRSLITRRPAEKSLLNDLLTIKTPEHRERNILETDGERVELSQLEEEGFSPYRIKKEKCEPSPKKTAKPKVVVAVVQSRKVFKSCDLVDHSNFMSISEIDLKEKQRYHKDVKKRSFSQVNVNLHKRKFGITRFNNRSLLNKIQPWQVNQK